MGFRILEFGIDMFILNNAKTTYDTPEPISLPHLTLHCSGDFAT
jgi:hypothetical protein